MPGPQRAPRNLDDAADVAGAHSGKLYGDQVLYVNPCEGMPVERIIEVTGGRRVVIVADTEDPELEVP